MDRYLPKVNCVEATNVRLTLNLHLQEPVYNGEVSSKHQPCSSYTCQFDSTPTLQKPVYNGQVSSKFQLCSSYKCLFDSTLTLQDPFYNGQVSSISQLCSNFKLMSV